MPLHLQAQVHPVWSTVRELRKKVGALLVDYPEAVRDATEMVASELLENAIKYGESIPRAPAIEFACTVEDDIIRVSVANGALDSRNIDQLRARIDELATSTKKAEPYLHRLQSLMSDPTLPAGLGLYRIGFEGEFDLHLDCEENLVHIMATRSTH